MNFTELEQKLKYNFKDKNLLNEALSHSSYSYGKKHIQCNERLEFLGDSVLSLIISQHVFLNLKDMSEGNLTKLRSSLVCESSLFDFANKINLGEYILLGKGEENTGGRTRRSILADAFEAVIAAIYLDGGFDKAKEFVLRFIPSVEKLNNLNTKIGDFKTILQEVIQQNPEEKINYVVAGEKGPAHNKVFIANVTLNSQIIGTGEGSSKKEAEQMAAKEALSLMGYETN